MSSISLVLRPMPEPRPRASQYSLYREEQPEAPGVRMLKLSAPPAKLMYTMALYGDVDLAAGGVTNLGDPVLRTAKERNNNGMLVSTSLHERRVILLESLGPRNLTFASSVKLRRCGHKFQQNPVGMFNAIVSGKVGMRFLKINDDINRVSIKRGN